MNFLFKLSIIPSSILGTVLIYKTYFGVPKYKGEEDLTGKVALVTGASSGIGQEIAYNLANRKATVVLGCRNMSECKKKRLRIFKKTQNDKVYCAQLDMESYESIYDFVRRLKKKISHVDILVHNAGYKAGDTREVSKMFVEKQLAINAIGPCLLTKLLMPVLMKSDSARVLFMVCPQYADGEVDMYDINQEKNYSKDKSFSQSQLMRMLLVKYFSSQNSPSKIAFLACDPGPTNSNFHNNASYNNNFVSRMIFTYLNFLILRNVWQAVETPVMCCVTESLRGVGGTLYRDLAQLEIDPRALDEKMANYVYLLCDKWAESSRRGDSNKIVS